MFVRFLNSTLVLVAVVMSFGMVKWNDMAVNLTQDDLYVEIYQASKDLRVNPSDAYVDKVWKLTPGLNGLEVDIEASYSVMKELGYYDESSLVFKQVEANNDLVKFRDAPIYRGNPEKKAVTINVNVAFGAEYVPSMLETLEEKGVLANFFIEGKFAVNNADVIRQIVEKGHIIGNHSYSHADFKTLEGGQMRNEISKTNEVLSSFTDDPIKYFAPPSGSYNQLTVDNANDYEMFTILWTLDTIDWQKPSPDVMLNRIIPKLHDGAVILMHPTENTAKVLGEMIDQIREKDYNILDLDKFLSASRCMCGK